MKLLLAVLLLTLASGCAEQEPETVENATAVADTPDETANAVEDTPDETELVADVGSAVSEVETEGSVTTENGSFVEYPDGLVVRPVSLEQVPNDWGSYASDDDALVRVTLSLENMGTEPVVLNAAARKMGLLYGPNWMDAEQDPGYMVEDGHEEEELSSEDPNRVGAGETVELFMTFVVPEEELGELAVEATVAMDRYTPFVFTDAETLL